MKVAGAVHPGRAVGEKAGRKEVDGVSGALGRRRTKKAHMDQLGGVFCTRKR